MLFVSNVHSQAEKQKLNILPLFNTRFWFLPFAQKFIRAMDLDGLSLSAHCEGPRGRFVSSQKVRTQTTCWGFFWFTMGDFLSQPRALSLSPACGGWRLVTCGWCQSLSHPGTAIRCFCRPRSLPTPCCGGQAPVILVTDSPLTPSLSPHGGLLSSSERKEAMTQLPLCPGLDPALLEWPRVFSIATTIVLMTVTTAQRSQGTHCLILKTKLCNRGTACTRHVWGDQKRRRRREWLSYPCVLT